MIILEHHDGRSKTEAGKMIPVVDLLYQLAAKDPKAEFVVHKAGLDPSTFIDAIEHKRGKKVLISSTADLNPDFGYVEDSPFIKVNHDVIYPTWKKSTTCFYISAALINQIAGQFPPSTNLLYWLNSLAKIVQPQGVLCYQVPLFTSQEKLTTIEVYKFIAQHYKRRWTLLLLLCHVMYEGRFPLFAFAKAQFYRSQLVNMDLAVLKESVIEPDQSMHYDVIIPTMGRPDHLKNVLLDLNEQQILPQKVIVIEQPAVENGETELHYLQNIEWQFEVIHEFTRVTGACRARNRAIDLATAPWILLFDDDVRIEKSFMNTVFDSLNKGDVKAMTFSCLQKGEVESIQTSLQWKTFGSGCSIIHRDVAAVCRFDLALEHGYGEDSDYGMQVRNSGFDVIYNPQINMLHFKAPMGGFRTPYTFPWSADYIQPKPSPQIMYFRRKNSTSQQLQGYKLVLFIKYYFQQDVKNPISYYKNFRKAWASSVAWSDKLPVHG